MADAAPPTPSFPSPVHLPPDPGPRLTVAEHLEDLRRRLIASLVALVIAVGLSLTQVGRILRWLQAPAAGMLPRLAFFTPTEPLEAYLKVALAAGIILALPVVLWQVWGFVQTGLTLRERAYGFAFVGWGSALFLAGVLFAYYALLPVSLRVLLSIGAPALLPVISIDRYLSFVTMLLFWSGCAFELPMLMVLLAMIGIVTPEWLRQQRPYAILLLAILAAVVTPTTDPFTMLLLMAPLVILYEVSRLIVWCLKPRPPA